MPVRRGGDPKTIQNVWNAVRFTLQQRQLCDMQRLMRYLQRMVPNTNQQQAERYVVETLRDNLIACVTKTGLKGSKAGLVTDTYKIPAMDSNVSVDDGHDWYCIECHLAGDVSLCKNCPRVFHIDCLKSREQEMQDFFSRTGNPRPENTEAQAEDVCSICKMIREEEKPIIEDKAELNYLLGFTLNRIRGWIPGSVTDHAGTGKGAKHPSWMSEAEITWRARMLLYQPMDVQIMDMKIRTCEYSKLAEFEADVLTIQHNVIVFHGPNSKEAKHAIGMVQDCRYDLSELSCCIDCYRHSNEKTGSDWFCIPCRPAHTLVWAKQKGYPYWPAKVIREYDGDLYDVRFFGAKHQRALIEKTGIRSIETPFILLQPQFKRSQTFNKAMTELHSHQRLLENPEEVARIMKAAEEARSRRALLNTSETSTLKEVSEKPPKKTRSKKQLPKNNNNNNNTINVEPSDDIYEFHDSPASEPPPRPPARKKRKTFSKDEDVAKEPVRQHDHVVSSSTENINRQSVNAEQPPNGVGCMGTGSNGPNQQTNTNYNEVVEKLHKKLEQMAATGCTTDTLVRAALDGMQIELDRMQETCSAHLRNLNDLHNAQISDIKKKQWCYNCEQEAIYHCCWNTAYCSTTCQEQHWLSEHKKLCKRKR